jgi:RND family efflux transporter MFP subunit
MIKSLTRFAGPVVVLVLGVGGFMLLHATKPEPEREEQVLRTPTVYTTRAARTDTVLDIQTQGEVRARTEIDVVTQVSGRIIEVSPEFTEGGQFRPGDVLLKIEDDDYRLALREAQSRVAAAELGVQQALADADVARKQLRGTPDPSPLALKQPQIAQARAALAAAEAALEQARIDLERTAITLPFAGRVMSIEANVGEYVNAGAVLGRAFGTDAVEVRLPLDDQQLAALGLPIGYTAPADGGPAVELIAEVAGETQSWTGRLARLDAAVNPETRLIYGLAEVRDPYGRNVSASGMPLAVGLFVEVRIDGRQISDAVSIPADGLRAGNQVYVLTSSDRLETRRVDVINRNEDQAVIMSGLKPGERVIVSALRNPINGMALAGIDKPDPMLAAGGQ